ncbi:MAG: glycoside hydrolase family 99-like domain-containing protein [candidate division FCPU426 bacterium]
MNIRLRVLVPLLCAAAWLGGVSVCPAGLMSEAEKTLFINFMVDYATPERSAEWKGWNYSNSQVSHNPDQMGPDQRRDIASCLYPLVGVYDMSDPMIAEYHCQLMKMIGADAGVFTLSFNEDPNAAKPQMRNLQRRVMENYFRYLKAYSLKGVLLFEDKAHWLWNDRHKTRTETVWAAFADLDQWLGQFRDVQVQVAGRPLVLLFSYSQQVPGRGESRFSPDEIGYWMKSFEENQRPILLAQWFSPEYRGSLDGYYEWPHVVGPPPAGRDCRVFNDFDQEVKLWESRHEELYFNLANGHYQLVIGGVWPGFEDTGCYGWGGGCRIIPRYNGKVYAYHWKRMIESNYPLVQIATWNDWGEGTAIEPSREYGTQYLELTREWSARWRKTDALTGNLHVPAWIYVLRKTSKQQKALEAAKAASAAIQNGRFDEAERLLQPFVQPLQLERKLP